MIMHLKQKTLFNIITTLGTHKNFKLYKNKYKIQLLFNTIHNSILLLRIKNFSYLSKFRTFNLFFLNFIKEYHLGIKQNFKFFNSLKNNFKLFFYLLYRSSLLSFDSITKLNNSISSSISLRNSSSYNNYYPYYYSSNLGLSNSFFYNSVYKDTFKLFSFSLINKFKNYTYLRSNKKKRFKQKESEKLAVLRDNLTAIKDNPYRLKFYYKYFEYKRLHSYWDKEAFLKKKFKYFNPASLGLNNNNTKDSCLLHFFYQYRKSRKLTNKYLLYKKKIFINFWLQAKIKRFSLPSYKLKLKNKKTRLKFYKVYLNSSYSRVKNLSNFNKYSLVDKYKKYLFKNKKHTYKLFLQFCLNNNIFHNVRFKNKNLLNLLNRYHNMVNKGSKDNKHLYNNSFKKIKNFKRFNIPPTFFWRRKRYEQLFKSNTNKLTKTFFFNQLKKNKVFRIKFKYLKWLHTQKKIKSWKFDKHLSYKKNYIKAIRGNLKNSNLRRCSNNKVILNPNNNKNYINDIIFDASNKMHYWSTSNQNLFHIKKSKRFNSIVNALEFSTNKYMKNFSFYKSNKRLNSEYAYWNIFKENKINFNKIRIKRKNKFVRFNKISKSLFKRSWFIIKNRKNSFSKFKGYHNLVPIYNYFFLKKVISLYKKLFISKILFSDFFFKKPYNIKQDLVNKNINILNSIHNIRLIDKKYGFKKRKERNLFNRLKKYKNIKTLLANKLNKLDNFAINNGNKKTTNNFNISQYKIKLNLLHIKKIISKLKIYIKKLTTTNLKKTTFPNRSLKMSNLRRSSFINFLKCFPKKSRKITFSNSFLDRINFNNNSRLVDFIGFKSPIYAKKNLLNSNKLRLVMFKKYLNKSAGLFSNFKKNKRLFNSVVLAKFTKNYFLKYNWGLNTLLKKNYLNFLKLFKYFSFYKVVNDNNYYLGYGKLSNHLNMNNENIFSTCNLFMYNFLNYTTAEKDNFFNKYNDSVSINQNLDIINTIKSISIRIDLEESEEEVSSASEEGEDDSHSIYEYDIINNKIELFPDILNSQHYMIKYNSLLLFNSLLSLNNNYLYKKTPLNLCNEKKNIEDIFKLTSSDIVILKWYLFIDNPVEINKLNNSFKELYSGLFKKFNNI